MHSDDKNRNVTSHMYHQEFAHDIAQKVPGYCMRLLALYRKINA